MAAADSSRGHPAIAIGYVLASVLLIRALGGQLLLMATVALLVTLGIVLGRRIAGSPPSNPETLPKEAPEPQRRLAGEVPPKPSSTEGPDPLHILERASKIVGLGLTVTDREGRIRFINSVEARRLDSKAEDLLGQTAPWVPQAPTTRSSLSKILLETEETQTPSDSPPALDVRVYSRSIRGQDGVPRWRLTLREDISRQLALEDHLKRRDQILWAVELAAERFLANPSWSSSLPEVLGALAEATQTREARLLTDLSLEVQATILAHLGGRPLSPEKTDDHPHIFQPRLGPLKTGTLGALPSDLRESLGFPETGSYVLLPLTNLGYLCLDSPEEGRSWTRAEMDALRAAGRMLGAALLRQKAEGLLFQREERFRTLLDVVSDPIASFDEEDHFTYVNRAFTSLLGYHLGNLLPRTLEDLLLEEDRPVYRERLESLRHAGQGSEKISVLTLRSQAGEEIPLECRLELRATEAGPPLLRAAFRDRRTEKAAQRVRRQFVSLVHHELKTPLTSILAAARLLESEIAHSQGEEGQRLLEILRRNTQRLERLIGKLLDLQRLSLGEMSYQLETFALSPLLEEAILARRADAGRRGHSIHFEPSPGLLVFADREKLLHVLDELLENACKFSWDGTPIRLELEREESHVWVHVLDEGPGLPEGTESELATGVPQTSGETMRHRQGAGIGLTLVKELVEGMGGRLLFDSRLGQGTRASVSLPSTA